MRTPILLTALLSTTTAHAEDAPASDAPSVADVSDAQLRELAEAEAAAGEMIIVEGVSPVDTPSAGVRVVSARALELTPRKNADDLLRVVPGST